MRLDTSDPGSRGRADHPHPPGAALHETRSDEPPPFGPRELGASVFIAAVILANAAPLVVPFESFPLTSAPMFAHYLGAGTPRYHFRWVGIGTGGRWEREIRATHLGARDVPLGRHFFGAVYGSIDPWSPFGHHPDDTPAAFEARLGRFFSDASVVLARRDPATWGELASIRLEVARLDEANRDAEVHVVGVYDRGTGRFVHTWRQRP